MTLEGKWVARNTTKAFAKLLSRTKIFPLQYQANIPMTKWDDVKADSNGIKQAIYAYNWSILKEENNHYLKTSLKESLYYIKSFRKPNF